MTHSLREIRAMACHPEHKHLVAGLLADTITEPAQVVEFMGIYCEVEVQPLSKQVKIGLANAIEKFTPEQRADPSIRHVLCLVHPKERN